jgi:hypothetical protein
LTYVGLTDLLSGVTDASVSELPAPQRHALEVGLLRTQGSDRPAQQRVLATAFLSTVRIQSSVTNAGCTWTSLPDKLTVTIIAGIPRDQSAVSLQTRARDNHAVAVPRLGDQAYVHSSIPADAAVDFLTGDPLRHRRPHPDWRGRAARAGRRAGETRQRQPLT